MLRACQQSWRIVEESSFEEWDLEVWRVADSDVNEEHANPIWMNDFFLIHSRFVECQAMQLSEDVAFLIPKLR